MPEEPYHAQAIQPYSESIAMVFHLFPNPFLGGAPSEPSASRTGGSWLGSPLIMEEVPLMEVVPRLPRFQRKPLENPSPGEHPTRANPYYDLVVRLPVPDDPVSVPVGIVSTAYQLIQHHEVVEAVVEALGTFRAYRPSSPVRLTMSRFGERMLLSLPLEEEALDPGDGLLLVPTVDCVNSVDGSTCFSLTLVWLRLVCSNGLVLREEWQLYRRRHLRGLDVAEIREVLEKRLAGITADRETFNRWLDTPLTLERVASWVDKVLRHRWGYHAAARAHHILTTGQDGEVITRPNGKPPSAASLRAAGEVPGMDVGTPLTLYTVAQVLAWIASRRSNVQERLEWRKQIGSLLRDLEAARA